MTAYLASLNLVKGPKDRTLKAVSDVNLTSGFTVKNVSLASRIALNVRMIFLARPANYPLS